MYALEFAQSALITRVEWRVFVTGFGNVETIDQVDIIWLATPIFTSIGELSWIGQGRAADVLSYYQVIFLVQGFYAHRIRNLAQSKTVAGAIIAVSRPTPSNI